MTRLDALEKFLDAATPGPWHHCCDEGILTVAPGAHEDAESYVAMNVDGMGNAKLIAAAPEALRQLIAVARGVIAAHHALGQSTDALIESNKAVDAALAPLLEEVPDDPA